MFIIGINKGLSINVFLFKKSFTAILPRNLVHIQTFPLFTHGSLLLFQLLLFNEHLYYAVS